MYLQLKTDYSTFQLYQDQQELYNKYHLKLETKKTAIEHTKKLGFIVGPNVKLGLVDYYINEIILTI